MNPFILTSYISPEYFCNRKKETKILYEAINNQRNITLISQRRMGKTGLIKHSEHLSKKAGEIFIYIDIFSTESFSDFVELFSKAIFSELKLKKELLVKQFISTIKSLRPVLNFDPIQQSTSLSLDVKSNEASEMGFEEICKFLDNYKKKIVIAIDEFQQIVEYPEKNIESILRSQFQHLSNISFIFSGSIKHLMISIFSDNRSPFYQSSQFLELSYIDRTEYIEFILNHFVLKNKAISRKIITDGIEWCLGHTFYVQFFFNRLFSITDNEIMEEHTNFAKAQILEEHNLIYDNYKKLLSLGQWRLIKSIACENFIKQPMSGAFINKYNLGATSSVKQAFGILKNKDLIVDEQQGYRVSDVFFMRWLQR